MSKEILEIMEEPLTIKDFDLDKNVIRLNKSKKVVLKKCLIDELGFSNLKTNGFEPVYNFYKKDDKIIIRVEGPGNCSINSEILFSGEYTIIRLKGNKKKDKEPAKIEENLYNSRELGKFTLDIPLKTEDFLVKNEQPVIEEKKGILILQFKLDKQTEYKGYNVNEEEEI
jgi:HSP20 family molecular chaperone IbpA